MPRNGLPGPPGARIEDMVGEPWNHNIHYHQLVLNAVPAEASRALDVGCGDGGLARKLREVVPSVVGVHLSAACIETARRHDGGTDVQYLHGDFLDLDLEQQSFDFISAIAVLHHVDAEVGLHRLGQLLRPGGTLCVIGCARSTGPADLPAELSGMVLHRLLAPRRQWIESSGPAKAPSVSYAGMRSAARLLLPGSSFRRLALWRYAVIWTKSIE